MGDALDLVLGGDHRAYYVVFFAVASVLIEIFSSYERYVQFLKWSTLSLFAYVAAALAVDVPWQRVAIDVIVPSIVPSADYLMAIVAILGTTISPYMFFWQSSGEAEDERVDPDAKPLKDGGGDAPKEIRRIAFDTYVGMGISQIIGLFIIVTTAATLHAHGITNIASSAQAAEALRPIAGVFAFAVFALGIIGTGLLAVPVLAGSSAYALGEALGRPVGLGRLPREAKLFYITIAVATLIGVFINFVKIDPIRALYWSAVLNGIVAVPLMVVMMLMSDNRRVMGRFLLPLPLKALGWLATTVMAVTAVALIGSWFL